MIDASLNAEEAATVQSCLAPDLDRLPTALALAEQLAVLREHHPAPTSS
ncbi:MAG: hypothetical protein H0T66_13490 [Geodermatophilaceae bacterium]|nr:hypothetical protein [Geodermatophilaceae bacterium]